MKDHGPQQPPLTPAPPHNELAEVEIIAAILADNRLYERLEGTLKPSDFYVPFYREVYEAIGACIRRNQRADFVTIHGQFRGKKIYELDAESYLENIADLRPPLRTPEALWDYAREILHCSAQREMAVAARAFEENVVRRDADLDALYDTVTKQFDTALASTRQREPTVWAAGEAAKRARIEAQNKRSRVLMDLRPLDKMTGGLFAGDLSIVGGRPSMGKTTVATEVALNVSRSRRHGVLLCSLEMSAETVAQRLVSSLAYRSDAECVPYSRYRTGFLSGDLERIEAAEEVLETMPMRIEAQAAMSVAQINSAARRAQSHFEARGTPLALVLVDYLGIMDLSRRWGDNKAYAIGEATAGLKELAKKLGTHVMLLHQLNREVEKTEDGRPQLHHLRDSGAIEQDADLVMLCYREERYLKQDDPRLNEVRNKMEIIVAKQRTGEIGSRMLFCSIANSKIADDRDFPH